MFSLPYQTKQVNWLDENYSGLNLVDINVNSMSLLNVSSSELKNKLYDKKLFRISSYGSKIIFEFSDKNFLIIKTSSDSYFTLGSKLKDILLIKLIFDKETKSDLNIEQKNNSSSIMYEYITIEHSRLINEIINLLELGEEDFINSLKEEPQYKTITSVLTQDKYDGVDENILSESLFEAKINPKKKIIKMNLVELSILYNSIQKIFNKNLDYINPDNPFDISSFRNQVYNRKNLPCFACGKDIKVMESKQMAIYYCSYCQK